ncbi:hypothetical protein ACP70R_008023 [Stipagrostis hirtigluma subsp. patula]
MAGDRLSDLPDDLLRRVLHFAPAKEGAATAVLSRRWRSLWRTSGAVNLDSRSYDRTHGGGFSSEDKSAAFFRGAEAALAAANAHSPVRRLSFHVQTGEEYHQVYVHLLLHWRGDSSASSSEHDTIRVYHRNPAASRPSPRGRRRTPPTMEERYDISLGTLPSATLRELHITNCTDIISSSPLPAGAGFRQLAALRLQGCTIALSCLQDMADAAPCLAALRLERTRVVGAQVRSDELTHDGRPTFVERYRLRCPALTSLTLAKCGWVELPEGSTELDVPRLRHFRYEGSVHRFSLKSPAPDIRRVDLHFFHDDLEEEFQMHRVLFWHFVQSFSNAKVLRLELDFPLECIAVADKSQDVFLRDKLFCNLECLELEGCYQPASKTAAMAIANLLRLCPVVRDLRVKLSKEPTTIDRSESYARSFLGRTPQLDFNKSVNQFRRRRRPLISLGGNKDDDDEYPEVSDIPGLSDSSFDCLQYYLRRVTLKLRSEDPNCFGVQLTKFFTDNALVLEEMYIDDGNHKMSEHMHHRVKRWIANSSKRRDLPHTTGIAVLPYEA